MQLAPDKRSMKMMLKVRTMFIFFSIVDVFVT